MPQCGSTRLRPPRRHAPHARPLTCFTLTAIAFLPAPSVTAQEPPSAIEYQVKAAFLYNFAKFVDWPPETFKRQEAPFVVGVLGNDPFSEVLIISGDPLTPVRSAPSMTARVKTAPSIVAPRRFPPER